LKALIGRKLGMTQLFDAGGNVVRATIVEAGPCKVTQVKTRATDGYNAVQLGFGHAKKLNRPLMGHLKAANTDPEIIREFRIEEVAASRVNNAEEADQALKDLELKVGDTLSVEAFEVGDVVKVSGTTKGKGFAGTIKRHNFKRGPKTHGSHNYRAPGSIGSMYPQSVIKGMRMAGRMGGSKATIKGLKVVLVDKEKNLIGLSGGVPGPAKGMVMLESK
jgi:large subunit ribosomal protein L3